MAFICWKLWLQRNDMKREKWMANQKKLFFFSLMRLTNMTCRKIIEFIQWLHFFTFIYTAHIIPWPASIHPFFICGQGPIFDCIFFSLFDLLAVDTWNMFNIWLKYSCRWANETGKKINFIVAMKFNLTLIFQWWSRNPKCILIGLVCLRHISSGFIFITLLKLFILNRWFIFYINNKANLFSVSDFNYKFWLD